MFTKLDDNQFGQRNSHLMGWGEDESGQAYMYPSVMNPTNESIKVPNQYADYISSEGYKKATGMIPKKPFGGIHTKTDTHMATGGWLDTYDEGGIAEELPIEETVIDPLVGTPTTKPLSKKQEYQNAIKNNYSNYIESVHNRTPFDKLTSEGHMNCIHGVCTVIEGTKAKKFNQNYIGNMTFADNAKKEGYYKVDPNKEGFEIGDVVQYAQTKEDAVGDRFNPKSLNPVNAKELVPQHAKIILDKYVDSDGITRYKVGHNGGSEDWQISTDPHDGRDLSETSLLEHFNKGFRQYDGIIVNRYDPDYVQKKEEDDKVETEAIKGKNQYASAYKNPPELDIKKQTYDSYGKPIKTEYTEAKPLIDFYKKNYQKIGKSADMPPEILNKLFYNQIGIAAQETEFDNPLTKRAIGKALVPDWALTGARKVAGMLGDDSTWVDDYWKKNADGVQDKYNNVDEFKKHLGEGSKLSPEGREYLYYNSPKSKGMFQQKELSKRGRILNSNFDTPENQFVSSMYLAVDNYHLLKKKYPDLSNDQLVDLTTLMHNAPSKALTPEFVNYYLKNNDVQYVNDVKSKRGVINQPDNLVKKIQNIQNEKIVNKLSSQEKASVMDWAKNLSKKKYGGWLDSYKPGGEKPWGDMSAKERAAYLDAKEANAKAETASRKQATKEHYQDYVKDSMKKTLEHPMFNIAQYFTPEGMAVGAIKGLANVGPDVAKGDYSAAAFDALTALPAVAPAVKNAYRINPWAEKLNNPKSSYRVAGLDAAEDFKKTGALRSQTPDVPKGATLQERAMNRPTAFPSFQKGYADLNYLPDEGGVIFKTDLPTFKRGELNPVTGFPIKGRHYAHRVIDPKTGATVTNIPGADVKMYNSDPHWLKGYQELPGSANVNKSEIDWKAWNKEIPKNKVLINEYNAIEETSKANGTWMKNPDGSKFEGTPEQFVQQNSSNFKKAFPNPVRDADNNIQINYHGQREGKPFTTFKPSQRGNHGIGNYTFPGNRKSALSYANDDEKRLYELYINSNNPQKSLKTVFSPEFNLTTGRLQPGYDYLKIGKEQVTAPSNYLKSARGNNGMFDMTNPNIYKSVVPIGLGAAALQQEKFGGWLDEYQDAGSTGVRPIQDNTRVVQTNFPKNLDELKAEQKKEINYQARKQAEQLMAINNAKNKEAQYQKDLKEGKVKKRISFMNYTPEEEVGIKGELARLQTIDNQRSTQEKLDDASLDVLTSIVPELPLLKYIKPAASLNKGSKVLKAAPENAFTYRGVVEPFEGATKLVRDEADAYYNFLQGRQNPYLAGQWKNENKEFMRQHPLTPDSYNGIRKKPSDPDYLNKFLLNGKPSEGLPYNYEFYKNTRQPTGKMEGIASSKDIKNINNDRLNFRDFETNKEVYNTDPADFRNFEVPGMYDEALGYTNRAKQDWYNKNIPMRGGHTDVPEFNQELNNMLIKLHYGKTPLAKSVKTNPTTSKNALMEALDNSRYEEGMTNLIPNEYMKKAKIPYTGIKAFQTLHPNEYGGFNKKEGGWLDDEFRRGGQKGLKKYTSKNIQSSVNDLFMRNETLFGPAGKKRYKPNLKYKDGGWLDNMY
jgi:hypothetical protein